MVKSNWIEILIVLALLIFAAGCDLVKKKDSDPTEDFKRGPSGLIMEFVPNYPGDKYIVSADTEPISIVVDVRNKGTYPPSALPEEGKFSEGNIYLSGFDDRIIDMSGLTGEDLTELKNSDSIDISGLSLEGAFAIRDKYYSQITDDQIENRKTVPVTISIRDISDERKDDIINIYKKDLQKPGKTKALSEMFLPAASPINPLGSIDTAQFDGQIIGDNILIDKYEPTILVTACYPYVTKASPNVCIDPSPFDDTQEKVCNIGSQSLPTQGAPIAVTKIDQEAATNKIQFKISIKNVGDGDVLKSGMSDVKNKEGNYAKVLEKCNPLGGGKLDRKDFDMVKVTRIRVGDVDLWNDDDSKNKCSPFADPDGEIIRLFDGEGFVICTLDITELGDVQSAYTTPISIWLSYNYRSSISKGVSITKLTAIS